MNCWSAGAAVAEESGGIALRLSRLRLRSLRLDETLQLRDLRAELPVVAAAAAAARRRRATAPRARPYAAFVRASPREKKILKPVLKYTQKMSDPEN